MFGLVARAADVDHAHRIVGAGRRHEVRANAQGQGRGRPDHHHLPELHLLTS
jgi:hypothetical protein